MLVNLHIRITNPIVLSSLFNVLWLWTSDMCEFSPQHHPSILDLLVAIHVWPRLQSVVFPYRLGPEKHLTMKRDVNLYFNNNPFPMFQRISNLYFRLHLNPFQRSFPFLVSKSRRLPGLPLLLRPLCFLCTCRLCCRSQSCWRSSGRSGRLCGMWRCLWREVRGCIEKVTSGWLLGLRIPGLDQPTWRKQVDKLCTHEILNSECETEYWKYVKEYVMILFMRSIVVIYIELVGEHLAFHSVYPWRKGFPEAEFCSKPLQ